MSQSDGWDDSPPERRPDKGDADTPMKIRKKDGSQWWCYSDGTMEEIKPGSPDYISEY